MADYTTEIAELEELINGAASEKAAKSHKTAMSHLAFSGLFGTVRDYSGLTGTAAKSLENVGYKE